MSAVPITPERVQELRGMIQRHVYAFTQQDVDYILECLAAYGRECGTCARFRITEPGRGSSWCDSKVSAVRGQSVDATFGCNKHEVKVKVTR